MPISDYRNSASRVPVTKVIIKLDTCTNVFGVAPCTATGAQCYNTFYTCKDKPNFARSTKDYKFCNAGASQPVLQLINALPLIDSISHLGTEIKDDKTITARVTVVLNDDLDYDQSTDPYWKARNTTLLNAQGSYIKKLVERNQFFKGRVVEVYEGYEGLADADYELTFSGKIENITRDGSRAKIECVDEISDLGKRKYPFKTDLETAETIGACIIAKNQEEMLKLTSLKQGDFALRTDFIYIKPTVVLSQGGSLPQDGVYYYEIIAYNAQGIAFAATEVFYCDTVLPIDPLATPLQYYSKVTVSWTAVDGASYYRIYGRSKNTDNNIDHYIQQTGTSFVDDGTVTFPNELEAPIVAYRIFELEENDATDLNNWTEITAAQTLELSAVTGLATEGCIKLEDEVIYYNGITGTTLQNILRLQYKTKAETKHYEGTNIYWLIWYGPTNPFTLLAALFTLIGASYDSSTFSTYAGLYSGINFSCYPLIKESDFAKLIFDLCYVLDLELWVNENGELTCRYASDVTPDFTITDDANIIVNTDSVDFNQEEIFTRFLLWWDRKDVTKATTEKTNFNYLHFDIDADAESVNMYNEEIPDEKTTVWINKDCGTVAEIDTYVKATMNKKAKRCRMPRAKFTFEVELKDSDIKTGHRISLSSNAFNDINGNDYSGKVAQVIKKEPKGNRIALTVRMMNTAAVTTTGYNTVQTFENPAPIKSMALNEVKVTGLVAYDDQSNSYTGTAHDVEVANFIKLVWDNMYASEEETATDITGTTYNLATTIVYPSMAEVVDLAQWQKTHRYKIYLFVANAGQTAPATARPTLSDANGKWYLIGIVPDVKSLDPTKHYSFTYNLPVAALNRYICFDVYADCNIVYDTSAPVALEVEVLQ